MYPTPVAKRCRFQRDAYEQKRPTFRKREDAWYKITPQKENPGDRLIHSCRKTILSARHARRATHCTDHAQTWMTVCGRRSSADLLSVCANGARTKRCDRTSIKISTRRTDHDLDHLDPIATPMRYCAEDLDHIDHTRETCVEDLDLIDPTRTNMC